MDINLLVSSNLKTIREKKKLSLDNVAKMTGVSKSMIGQIERGEVNPTISVLWKIANGLKISFTTLVDIPLNHAEVIKCADSVSILQDDGRFANYPVFPFDENKRFETYRIEIKPYGILTAEPHLVGAEEFITVFSGEVTITVEEMEYKLCKGDSIRFKADVVHGYRNHGMDMAELNMVIYYAK